MSSRARPPTNGISRPRAPGVATSAVRPNLFRSQLTRRPTASSSNSTDTVRLDVEVLSDGSEIVVRNQLGEIELGDPPTPIMEADESEDRDDSQQKERQKLSDALERHSINHSAVPDQSEELLEAIRASLRAKVTALADDNWMFEPEDQIR
ncbi:hypothetical protein NOR_05876 [Metarhizium rileyi]|uniref:Uncharacterized protein n=1 Tax=Metarhizium rileyi (strain RCEF 4871) TaxID=1649241 RepID=A0A167BQX3_METRR|nr:hypothetical protein NOR_05876 [Metarhizium rileyi RCEF 4871]TWU73785.1 hypothetical protein ED733_004017 [Metarhizium rileyi]